MSVSVYCAFVNESECTQGSVCEKQLVSLQSISPSFPRVSVAVVRSVSYPFPPFAFAFALLARLLNEIQGKTSHEKEFQMMGRE